MAIESFNGLRVLALENRRAAEVDKLIRSYGGVPTVAPAMREVALASNREALEFADDLLRGGFDLVIFTTGAGVRKLTEIVESRHDRASFIDALCRVKVAARGPKPSAVLRAMGVPIAVTAAEPCTWREMTTALEDAFGPSLEGLRVAVQEYGSPSVELVDALVRHHAVCTRVPVYRWALPEDLEPLRDAVRSIAGGKVDVLIFLTSVQVTHLFQVAEELGAADALREGMRAALVLSIGPTTSEELARHGIVSDFEPSHPRMGFLMNEAAQRAAALLEAKRGSTVPRCEAPEVGSVQGARQIDAIRRVHEIGRRMAASDPLHSVLNCILSFVQTLVRCDSCFIYVLEGSELVLRASKNPHPDVIDHLGLRIGQGITGWVAEHREPVVIDSGALRDARFQGFKDLPEDSFEAFLSVPILARGRVVGVINVQHRQAHHYTPWEVQTISTAGFLVGAEIEAARLESERNDLSDQLEARKLVERAKGILQRELTIGEEAAYRMMQKESRQRRKTMREIAEAVILSEELRKTILTKGD